MFAFAIWDAGKERLLLARDRFGEKPLFLHESAHGLCFASEIKALLRVPGVKRAVDPAAVWDYLAYRYVPGPQTLFSGIRKLQPGTTAVWERGKLTESRYWSPPDRSTGGSANAPAEVAGTFLSRLDEAVRLQMVSDVPFGAFLSGGLDSSTIVALMSRHNSKVNTFSVGFGEAGYSELDYARQVARHFGTDAPRDHGQRSRSHRTAPGAGGVSRCPGVGAFRHSDLPARLRSLAQREDGADRRGQRRDSRRLSEARGRALGPALPAPAGAVRRGLFAPLARALPYGFHRIKTAVTNLNIEDWRERYVRWFGA